MLISVRPGAAVRVFYPPRPFLASGSCFYSLPLCPEAYHVSILTATPLSSIEPRDFAIFQDHGYMGLYGGLRENDIHARKGLTSDKQKILDYMGSEELASNIFRAAQTDAKLRREQVSTKDQANVTHYEVGHKVR